MAGLVEIPANDLSDPSRASVKDLELPADIKLITMNMGSILKGIEIKRSDLRKQRGTVERMQIDMPKYEVRNLDGGRWEDVSEKNFMETLADIFDQVTPIINDILRGEEVATPYGVYRLKN